MPLLATQTLPLQRQLTQVLWHPAPARPAWCAHSLRAPDHPLNQDCCLALEIGDQGDQGDQGGQGGQKGAPRTRRMTLAHAAQPSAILVPPEAPRGARALVLAVADGLGGHAGGELASTAALGRAGEYLLQHLPAALSCSRMTEKTLRRAAIEAQRAVRQRARALDRPRMGTTLTLACLTDDRLLVAHVGDSRCYRLHRGGLYPLTTDHNVHDLIRQGRLSRHALNVIDGRVLWNVVGINAALTVQIEETELEAGDRVLLCTDGLHEHLDDRALAGLLGAGEPRAATLRLAAAARARGSDDDITALVVKV